MEAGCAKREASELLEAICPLDAWNIHLILTDITVPCSKGISLLTYLTIFFRQAPVVIIAAFPEDTEDLEPDALLCELFGERGRIALTRRLRREPPPWASIRMPKENVLWEGMEASRKANLLQAISFSDNAKGCGRRYENHDGHPAGI